MYKPKWLFHLYIVLIPLFIITFFISIVGVNSATKVEQDLYNKSWAVVIGINNYKHWPKLAYAVNDAVDIKEILEKKGFQTKLFINEEATKQNIMSYLTDKLPVIVGKDDRLLFYFSGHGNTKEFGTGEKRGYIIPVKGKPDSNISNISMAELKDITKMISAKHIFFVLDACFSGSLIKHATLTTRGIGTALIASEEDMISKAKKRACPILTAGGENEPAKEDDGHGIFTDELIKALEGKADKDGNNYITGYELSKYVRDQVYGRTHKEQRPVYGDLIPQGGDIIFRLPIKVEEDFENVKAKIDQEKDLANIERFYDNFRNKHPKATDLLRILRQTCDKKINEIEDATQLINLIIIAINKYERTEISKRYLEFLKEYKNSIFTKEIKDEKDLMEKRIRKIDDIEIQIQSSECLNELDPVQRDINVFNENYLKYETSINYINEEWAKRAFELKSDIQQKISNSRKKINRAETPGEIVKIEVNFTSYDCYKDSWYSDLKGIAQENIEKLYVIAQKAFEVSNRKLEKVQDTVDAHEILSDFIDEIHFEKHNNALEEIKDLETAEKMISIAGIEKSVKGIFDEFIDILEELTNYKTTEIEVSTAPTVNSLKTILLKSLKQKALSVKHKNTLEDIAKDRIKHLTEITNFQNSIFSKITGTKNLCEINQIEEDVDMYIHKYPGSEYASILKNQTDQKRSELESKYEIDLEMAKNEIYNEWHNKDINKIRSRYDKNHPCTNLYEELEKDAKLRLEMIEKVATQHKSILLKISEAHNIKKLGYIMETVEMFTQKYQDYPYISELSEKLKNKRNELKFNEELAYDNAKYKLEGIKKADDTHFIYTNFQERFPDSKYLQSLKEITDLKDNEIKISNAKTVDEINIILAKLSDLQYSEENKELIKEKAKEKIERIRLAEATGLQGPLLTKIADARDLCELNEIKDVDVDKYIQSHPDKKYIAELKKQIDKRETDLEREIQINLDIAKRRIDKTWNTPDIQETTSLFNKNNPCDNNSQDLEKYAQARVETIKKITAEYKSIIAGINDAQNVKELEPIGVTIDKFAQTYRNAPYLQELSNKSKNKHRELVLKEEKAYTFAKNDIQEARKIEDAHLVYSNFEQKYPDSKFHKDLKELTNLRDAEIKISIAGTEEVANIVLNVFIDILHSEENKRKLRDKVREKIERIKLAEATDLQESLRNKIAAANDLCDLNDIKDGDLENYIKDHPDSMHVSLLNKLIYSKNSELRRENQVNLKEAKKTIDAQWSIEDVNTFFSIFKNNNPCRHFTEELDMYAKSRTEKINEILAEYESILTKIQETKNEGLLVSIEENIEEFSLRYMDSPYISELSDKLQKRRTTLKSNEKLAFEYAKSSLDKVKKADDANNIYQDFQEEFPVSTFLAALEDIKNLKVEDLKIENFNLNIEPDAGKVFQDQKTGIKFVYVPGGTFNMGDSFGEGNNDDESHTREVMIDGFWMSKYEITQGQWEIFMDDNPSHFKSGDEYPVEMVSWNDVQAFVRRINLHHKGQHTFRLPTEAEWEYACREGGREVRFGNGEDIIDPEKANFNGDSRYKVSYSVSGDYRKQTTPVGIFPPNRLGLHDMSGNVWEWTQKSYESNDGKLVKANYNKDGVNNYHVIRGGSWNFRPEFLRATSRDYFPSDTRLWDTGFRLVLTIIKPDLS